MMTETTDPGLQWFEDLAQDNTRDFWLARKGDYQAHLRRPFEALLAEIDASSAPPAHGPWRVYRPHEDTRFRPGGPPLKTFLGAVAETTRGGGLFVQVEQRGLMAALGMPYLAPDQLKAWRRSVDDEMAGGRIASIVTDLLTDGLTVRGGRPDPLRGAPRGMRADHPRLHLLQWKGVEALSWPGRQTWADPVGRAAAVVDVWQRAGSLLEWLEREVGPSSMPRPSR